MPVAPLLMLLGLTPPPNLTWQEVRSGATTVRCAPGEAPWCVAEAILQAPASTLGRMLMDFESYPAIFSRITEARALGPGLATLTMRLPAPLAPRDAVARFTTAQDGLTTRVDWSPAPDAAPLVPGVVRLTGYAGRWTLTELGDGRARARCEWASALGGDVPDWALPTAWSMQGAEMMEELEAAARR
ncbi:hypothetical protein L6R49_01870 [Myxococcota bacterium]|nr:hypothetical protein [Myxococcota bacterium]